MLCAAESDPFEGPNYRLAAVIHESLLCPLLNKATVYAFRSANSVQGEMGVVVANQGFSSSLPFSYRQRKENENFELPAIEGTNSVGTQVRARRRRPKDDSSNLASDLKVDNDSSDNLPIIKSHKKNKSDKKEEKEKKMEKKQQRQSIKYQEI